MILYYSASQKTKVFANVLGDILGISPYELKSPLNDRPKLAFLFKSLYLAISGKPYIVSNMPTTAGISELYLCAPIWGGGIAAPAKYFLRNAKLNDIKINLLLTCGSFSASDKYKLKALVSLRKIECIPGEAYIFATTDTMPEPEVIKEQLVIMLGTKAD